MALVKEIKPDARILIVDLAFIGDILMSTPAYKNIRSSFPDAFIDVLVAPACRPIVENINIFNRVWATGMKTGGVKSIQVEQELTRAECYDIVICFHRGHGTLIMLYMAGVPERVGFTNQGRFLFLTHGIPFRLERHRAWNHLKLLEECLPIEIDYNIPTFMNPDDESLSKIDEIIDQNARGKPLIAINPNAAWPTKRWLPEGFAKVADCIAEMGYTPVLIGSPKEKNISAQVLAGTSAEILDLTGRTSLKELAALFSRCDAAISNDSGPMHLANAVGTPVVSIFGPTDPERCGPWLGKIPPIQADNDCSKCYRKRCWHLTCMQKVTSEEVMESLGECIRINQIS